MYTPETIERMIATIENNTALFKMLLIHANTLAHLENLAADAKIAHEQAILRHETRLTELTVKAYEAAIFTDAKTGEKRPAANADERKIAIQKTCEEDRILRARAKKLQAAAAAREQANAALAGEVTIYSAWKEIARLRAAEFQATAARQG